MVDGTKRNTVHYSGHVQGVGFRYTTQRIAGRFNVTGYVRNLPDGRVELVAEGPPDDLAGLLADVEAAMGAHIRDARVEPGESTGEFTGFEIRT